MHPSRQPTLLYIFVGVSPTSRRISKEMAAPNDFQTPIVPGFKTLGITEREIEIRLCLVL
jgi:hypothetical protein